MDQSKWALPRNYLLTSSKELCSYTRPRMKLHGVWLHNCALNLYVVAPGVPADGSLILEALSLSLEGLAEQCRELSVQMPRECLIWVAWPRLTFL